MVRCSSSDSPFAEREIRKTGKFEGYDRIEDINNEIDESVLILNRADKGVILLMECNSIPLRDKIIRVLKERMNFKFYDILVDEKNKNLPAKVNTDFELKKIDVNTVVLVHGIENALPEIIGYLNWNREIFLELKLRTVIFCPTYFMDEIMKSAPDFYRFSYRITIKEKSEFTGVAEMPVQSMMQDIYYKDENELKNNIKIQEHLLRNTKEDYKIADISSNLGNLYLLSYDYDRSIEYFKNSAKYYEKLNDKKGILMSNIGIGLVYSDQNRWSEAIKCYEESLKIALEIGDKTGESKCYTNLGNAYRSLGHFKREIEYHEKALKTVLYASLGIDYDSLRDFKKAVEYHEKALKITLGIGDKAGESACYTNLGNVYYGLRDFKKAVGYFEKSLKIALDIGDEAGESKCYTNLGLAYEGLRDLKKAVGYFEKSLKIALDIGDTAGESKCYGNLGLAYDGLGDLKKAVEFYLKAEEIFKENGQKHDLKKVYKNMAIAYGKMNMHKEAEEYRRKAKEIRI